LVEPISYPTSIDLTATAVGAVQGGLFADQLDDAKRIDITGLATIGLVTGLGGGALRDVMLNEPLAALKTSYILVAIAAVIFAVVLKRLVVRLSTLIEVLDAATLALFMVAGTVQAIDQDVAAVPAVLVGVVAGTGGSVLRDLLLRQPVSLLQVGSLYGVAAIAGATTLVALDAAGVEQAVAATVAGGVTIGLRLLAFKFGWRTPSAQSLRLGFEPSHSQATPSAGGADDR
jgi:uncharacterized membrane protein YeiH